MKKIILPFLALILLFTGCARTEFTVSSVRLIQDRTDDVRTLTFSFFPSDAEESYALSITSPDGRMTWKGNMMEDEEGSFFLDLAITPGTDFPAGEYSYMIYSSNGTEQKGTARFRGALDVTYELDWPTVSWDVPGEVYGVIDGEEEAVSSPLDLTHCEELRYTDENFNTYSFTIGG